MFRRGKTTIKLLIESFIKTSTKDIGHLPMLFYGYFYPNYHYFISLIYNIVKNTDMIRFHEKSSSYTYFPQLVYNIFTQEHRYIEWFYIYMYMYIIHVHMHLFTYACTHIPVNIKIQYTSTMYTYTCTHFCTYIYIYTPFLGARLDFRR